MTALIKRVCDPRRPGAGGGDADALVRSIVLNCSDRHPFCHRRGDDAHPGTLPPSRVECKTIPGLDEVIGGNGLAQIREVSVEDLLGRTPVHLEENQIRGALEGKVVLVTGAAGSIGSELCRQIARFHPAGIVGFEIAESPLFEIDREMRRPSRRRPFTRK